MDPLTVISRGVLEEVAASPAAAAADDISAFFDPFFTVDCVYTPQGGEPTDIKVIFTPAERGNQLQATGIENINPQAVCATRDVPGLRHNDQFVIAGTVYYCAGMTDDGTGITTVDLSEDRYDAL